MELNFHIHYSCDLLRAVYFSRKKIASYTRRAVSPGLPHQASRKKQRHACGLSGSQEKSFCCVGFLPDLIFAMKMLVNRERCVNGMTTQEKINVVMMIISDLFLLMFTAGREMLPAAVEILVYFSFGEFTYAKHHLLLIISYCLSKIYV